MEEKDKSVLLGFDTATYQKSLLRTQKKLLRAQQKLLLTKNPAVYAKKHNCVRRLQQSWSGHLDKQQVDGRDWSTTFDSISTSVAIPGYYSGSKGS